MIHYYFIIGKNRHVPKCLYSQAENVKSAKIDFYLNRGDVITSIQKITKKKFIEQSLSK